GASVALSADGNTAIVGGDQDAFGRGAAWVFTRSGVDWTQQAKLVGTGGGGGQGHSVALSADGNTATVGGNLDNQAVGAAYGSPAAAACGPSRVPSWSAPARLDQSSSKASRSRCPPTATPPWSAGRATTAIPARCGCSPAAAACGPSRATSWSAA